MIIDSHCHLDYPNLYERLDDVVKKGEINQVKKLLTICTTLESFEKIKLIIKNTKIKKIVEYLLAILLVITAIIIVID